MATTIKGAEVPPPAVVADEGSARVESELVWGVGTVATRLGIAASTLRTWERRYDVGPTHRTPGGHRRYTERDIERVSLIQLLIGRGAPARDAARVAHALDAAGLAEALAAEGAQDGESELTPEELVDELLAASVHCDGERIGRLAGGALRTMGVVAAWTSTIAPALIRIGHEWSIGALGIAAEHLATERLVGELRAHTRALPAVDTESATILLASAEDDQHSIPVVALECALAEAGLGCHVMGPRFPADALAEVTAQLRPAVVFLWASLGRPVDDRLREVVEAIGAPTTVLLGGPGWPHEIGLRVGHGAPLVQSDLRSTVDHIVALAAGSAATMRA